MRIARAGPLDDADVDRLRAEAASYGLLDALAPLVD